PPRIRRARRGTSSSPRVREPRQAGDVVGTELHPRRAPRRQFVRGSMDLEQRLKQLEGLHDWNGVVEALEQGIIATEEADKKAEYHLRLGRLLHTRFLQGVRALKHFQDAYKLNPTYGAALSEARAIYWELGKLNMVQKLLELQLKNTEDAAARVSLLAELGDVLFDMGDHERAAQNYAKAIELSNGAASDLPERLFDAELGAGEWQDRIGALLRQAHEASDRGVKCRLFLRAARIARRFAPDEVEGLLARAYAADPSNRHVAALYEGLLVEKERAEAILEAQREALKSAETPAERAAFASDFGARWALRHQNVELGVQFMEESLRTDPGRQEAFTYLRDVLGARGGEWDRLIRLADELSDRSSLGPSSAHLLAQAGMIAWKQRGDMVSARRFFERLALIDSENPALVAFESQIGERLVQAAPQAVLATAVGAEATVTVEDAVPGSGTSAPEAIS